MATKQRIIWSFEKDHEKATALAAWLRERGYPTRIYQRTVRAEGLCILGYVIVTDARAAERIGARALPEIR